MNIFALESSATAFVILLSGVYKDPTLTGIQLTQNAVSSQVGPWGTIFVAANRVITISGADVPKATIVKPINTGDNL